jgi:hypothetical protein
MPVGLMKMLLYVVITCCDHRPRARLWHANGPIWEAAFQAVMSPISWAVETFKSDEVQSFLC